LIILKYWSGLPKKTSIVNDPSLVTFPEPSITPVSFASPTPTVFVATVSATPTPTQPKTKPKKVVTPKITPTPTEQTATGSSVILNY